MDMATYDPCSMPLSPSKPHGGFTDKSTPRILVRTRAPISAKFGPRPFHEVALAFGSEGVLFHSVGGARRVHSVGEYEVWDVPETSPHLDRPALVDFSKFWVPLGAFALDNESVDRKSGTMVNKPSVRVFGRVLSEGARKAWRAVGGWLIQWSYRSGACCPIVLYHGTHDMHRASICEGGLSESVRPQRGHAADPRFQGPGVALGHFFKASRFAAFDALYKMREHGEAVVFMALLFPLRGVLVRGSFEDKGGNAEDAYVEKHAREDTKRARDLCKWSDHKGKWRDGYDAVYVPVPNPVTSNAEWCAKADRVAVHSFVKLDMTAYAKTCPTYMPHHREVRVVGTHVMSSML